MKRVPVSVVILLLAQEGIHANPRQIRNWRLRGHITRADDGYDLAEIAAYIEARGLERRAA